MKQALELNLSYPKLSSYFSLRTPVLLIHIPVKSPTIDSGTYIRNFLLPQSQWQFRHLSLLFCPLIASLRGLLSASLSISVQLPITIHLIGPFASPVSLQHILDHVDKVFFLNISDALSLSCPNPLMFSIIPRTKYVLIS